MTVSGASMTTGEVLALGGVLKSVTAFDAFGRDYKLGEIGSFDVRRGLVSNLAQTGGRMVNLGSQREWTSAFFAPAKATQAWAGFGPRGTAMRSGLGFDQSLRAGVDTPMAGGSVGLRLTGEGAARSDFASDAALAPLSFFASSELLNRSAMVSFSTPTSETGRLVTFAAVSGGARIAPEFHQTFASQNGYYDPTADRGLQLERTPREQAGFGVGWWKQPDERTVVGVTVSSFRQKHAFYDLASDLDAFDKPTQVTNFGVAAMREYGRWDLFGAVEATSIQSPESSGPIRFTDATLASGEVGVRRSNLLFSGRDAKDALSVSLAMAPQALSGALQLNYMDRTADGLGLQAVDRSVALSDLTGRTLRLQSAYTVKRGEGFSFALATGADLDNDADVSVAGELNWSFR